MLLHVARYSTKEEQNNAIRLIPRKSGMPWICYKKATLALFALLPARLKEIIVGSTLTPFTQAIEIFTFKITFGIIDKLKIKNNSIVRHPYLRKFA